MNNSAVFEIKIDGLDALAQTISKINGYGISIRNLSTLLNKINKQQQDDIRNLLNLEDTALNRKIVNSEILIRKKRQQAEQEKTIAQTLLIQEKRIAEQYKNNINAKINSNEKFAQSLTSLKGIMGSLAFGIGIGGTADFAKQIIDAQSKIEGFKLTLKNLLGTDVSDVLFNRIKQFTTETPFEFEKTKESITRLIGSFRAAGASSKKISDEVIPTLRSLGNIASALGGGDGGGEVLNRLTYAFGQVQAAGRLMGTEVRQITETGFPLLSVMSERLGIKVSELQKRITDGKVSFKDFSESLLQAGSSGGIFAGQMDSMVQTVTGKIGVLKDTFFFGMAQIGDSLAPAAKKVIDGLTAIVTSLIGTESAVARTIKVVQSLAIGFASYIGVTKIIPSILGALTTGTNLYAVALARSSALLDIVKSKENLSNAVKGFAILRTTTLTALENAAAISKARLSTATEAHAIAQATDTLASTALTRATLAQSTTNLALASSSNIAAESQLRMATASKVLMSSLGFITLAITAATVAYQIYKSSKEKVVDVTSEETRVLKTQQSALNENVNAVLRAGDATNERRRALETLKNTQKSSFGWIDIETTKNAEVLSMLKLVNAEYETRIALSRLGFKISQQKEKSNKEFGFQADFTENYNRENKTRLNEDQLAAKLGKQKADLEKRARQQGVSSAGVGGRISTSLGRDEDDFLTSYKNTKVIATNTNNYIQAEKLNNEKLKNQETQTLKEANERLKKSKQTVEVVKQIKENSTRISELMGNAIVPSSTKAPKSGGGGRGSSKAPKETYTESLGLQDRRRLAEQRLSDAEGVSNKIRAIYELKKVNEDAINEEFKDKRIANEKLNELEIKFNKEKSKLINSSEAELEKSRKKYQEAELSYTKASLKAKSDAEHLSRLEALQADFKANLNKEVTEAGKLEVTKKYNQLIYEENRRASLEEYNAKLKEIKDELNLNSIQISKNTSRGNLKKNNFLISNPNASSSLISEYNRGVDNDVEIQNNDIISRNAELNAKLLEIQNNFQKEAIASKKSYEKEQSDIDNSQSDIALKKAQELRRKQLLAMRAFYDAAKVLILGDLDTTISVLEKIDTARAKSLLNQTKTQRDATKGIFDASKGFVGSLRFSLGNDEKGQALTGGFGDLFKKAGTDALKGGGNVAKSFLGGMKSGLSTAIKANPAGAAITGLVAAYKIFDAVAGAIVAKREAKVREAQERLIKQNQKDSDALKSNYDKLVKDLDDRFQKDSLLGGLSSDKQTIEQIDAYSKQIEALLVNNKKKKQIEEDYLKDVSAIRERYGSGLNSSDERVRLETEGVVNKQIEGLAKRRSELLIEEAKLELERVNINKDAEDKIAEIKKEGGDNQKRDIDEVNSKRDADLKALLSYNETVALINENYDKKIIDAKNNTQKLTEQQLATHLLNLDNLRKQELLNLSLSGEGLANLSEENADKLAKIQDEKEASDYERKIKYDEAKKQAEIKYRKELYALEKSTFEANKKIQLSDLRIERAKASRKLFGKGKLLDAIDEAISEINGLSFPELSFFKGTDNTSKEGRGNIDGRGGFLATLHPREQVMSSKEMDKMTMYNNGKRPSRNDVIDNFKFASMFKNDKLMAFPKLVDNKMLDKIHYFDNSNLEKELKGLRKDIKSFNNERIVNNIDKGGITTFVETVSSKKRILNSRYNN